MDGTHNGMRKPLETLLGLSPMGGAISPAHYQAPLGVPQQRDELATEPGGYGRRKPAPIQVLQPHEVIEFDDPPLVQVIPAMWHGGLQVSMGGATASAHAVTRLPSSGAPRASKPLRRPVDPQTLAYAFIAAMILLLLVEVCVLIVA